MKEIQPIYPSYGYHELPTEGQFMSSAPISLKPRPQIRPFMLVVFSVLACIAWAVGVFYYQVNQYHLFNPEIWWFRPKDIFNVPFLVDSTIAAFREQWVALLALAAVSFLPLFRRAIQDRLRPKDSINLFLFLAFIHLLLAAQLFYLNSRDIGFNTFGVFFVMVAGLLGGWRLGVQIGVVNMLLLGGIFYYKMVVEHGTDFSFIRVLLTELHLIAPIWGGLIVGYLGERLGFRRFNWPFLVMMGLSAELLLIVTTMISSWSPVEYVHRFVSHMLATPLMFMGFCWLMHYHQSSGDGKLKLTQTELALAEAELKALRAQINPHFMVNSLSVIHHLVRTQPDIARNLLLDLSDLFQHSLRAGDFVPLRQELEHVRR
jgi:LytS/YehU family sensor histidine kinase